MAQMITGGAIIRNGAAMKVVTSDPVAAAAYEKKIAALNERIRQLEDQLAMKDRIINRAYTQKVKELEAMEAARAAKIAKRERLTPLNFILDIVDVYRDMFEGAAEFLKAHTVRGSIG